jgi:hypothetical protein
MADERKGYQSYLLRLWESNEKGEHVWRASVESPLTGERRGFATLQALFAFLRAQTEDIGGQGEQMRRGGQNERASP